MNGRVGQVWRLGDTIYLVVDAPFEAPQVSDVMRANVWYHPCVLIEDGVVTILGEIVNRSWEDDATPSMDGMIIVSMRRERIA